MNMKMKTLLLISTTMQLEDSCVQTVLCTSSLKTINCYTTTTTFPVESLVVRSREGRVYVDFRLLIVILERNFLLFPEIPLGHNFLAEQKVSIGFIKEWLLMLRATTSAFAVPLCLTNFYMSWVFVPFLFLHLHRVILYFCTHKCRGWPIQASHICQLAKFSTDR